jgi:hypothetical protein
LGLRRAKTNPKISTKTFNTEEKREQRTEGGNQAARRELKAKAKPKP